MGQVSQSWQPSDSLLISAPPFKVSQLSISRQNGACYFFTIARLSRSSCVSQNGGQLNEWNHLLHIHYCIHRILWIFIHCWLGHNNHLCRSLWPIASIFSTGILCIFFFASLCSSIPFFAPATSSAKSLWFRSSLQYVSSTHGPVTFLLNGIITWERLPHVFQSIQKVTWLP